MNSNRTSSSHNSRNLKILNASFDVPRPPGGGNSPLPSQGRSVRELEEQMSALRKENFNLKLRIYFLEEGQPGARADSSTESLSKQLIDAKIEIATLRKTVDVKMELLKDAARAISHHEELQRKADIDSQAIIDELQEQIHAYQMAESGGQPVENIAKTRKMLRLESEVQRLEEELVNIEARNVAARNELEFMLAERLESLTACEGKIQELAIKNSELVERLEKETASAESSNEAIDSLKVELEACRKENQDLVTSIRTLKHDMKRQVRSMKEAANTMDVQRQSILLLEATIKRKEKSCGSMQKNVLNYEALIAKLNAELETMRQQNVYFRELSENLQQKEVRQLDRGVAIVQPMRMTADAGRFVWQSGTIVAQEPLPLERQSGEALTIQRTVWSAPKTSSSTAAATSNVSVSAVRLSSGPPPDQTYPVNGHDRAKYGLLQLFAAKLDWISAVPLALGHLALKIILLAMRLHSCLQNVHIPLRVSFELGHSMPLAGILYSI
uniref:Centrosomin, isoform I n=1 Tax=Drosophila melanogaster TaxID=7227 RepID=A0A0B4K6Z9_DROME|nr:centrosomin, isoform I [Drosophila melanogaster]AFH08045.1 centrosomin, isoform I [Drosophila melanogaster]|eukprot:NP_001246291.1 centrosomin, isoform I [Drosophila melanogaster]